MKKGVLILLGILAFGLVMGGCKKDDPPAISAIPDKLVGKWGQGGIVFYEFTAAGQVIPHGQNITACGIAVTGNNNAGTIKITSSPANRWNDSEVVYSINTAGDKLTLSDGSGIWDALSGSSTFDKLL
ncbi:MAG: hypothetical protein LBG07_04695 [Treponema sp.]|nr:hypothetical protein [Treponema sp.]